MKMNRCTLLVTAALSLVISTGLSIYDPLVPLTEDDTLVIVGFSAILVLTVRWFCRRLFNRRSAS